MKIFIFFLTLLSISAAQAKPVDPIFPWPTGMETRDFVAEDISGDWLAYNSSASQTYYIHFEFEQNVSHRMTIKIKPTNLENDNKSRVGLAYWGHHIYWGHISMDGERYSRMVIFREKGSVKVRIENSLRTGYVDLILQRWPWGKPL